jgi:tRNA A64-2'-O-ribosylphosphate transferase
LGGCVIVDSTRKGKHFPDSFNRTVPIWCCVINRCAVFLRKTNNNTTDDQKWNELVMPSWISSSEKAQIEERLPIFLQKLLRSNTPFHEVIPLLKYLHSHSLSLFLFVFLTLIHS